MQLNEGDVAASQSKRIRQEHHEIAGIQVKTEFSIHTETVLESKNAKLSTSDRQQIELKRKRKSTRRFQFPSPFNIPSNLDVAGLITPPQEFTWSAKAEKVLILGTMESGKSTLFKSMCQADFYHGSRGLYERLSYKQPIFSNTVQLMRVVLEAMEALEIPLENVMNENYVETIFMQDAEIADEQLPREVCNAIGALWKDNGVIKAVERSNEYQLSDNAV